MQRLRNFKRYHIFILPNLDNLALPGKKRRASLLQESERGRESLQGYNRRKKKGTRLIEKREEQG